MRDLPVASRSVLADVEWWAASGRYRVERSVNPDGPGRRRVEIRVPQRGEKKALLEMVTRNAGEEFTRHRLKRAADHNARARALNALQDALDLPEAPLRIECYDMSHLQGTDYVGSMVVMEDGLPRPQEYRRFKIRTVEQNDDFAAMGEVLTRRLRAYLAERDKPVEDRRRRFAYPPQLLLVDGGQGQLNVALRVLEELGLEEEIPVAALAKQFEEVYLPGRADPLRIPRTSEALYLLQQIRDEAHRFAITYHRNLRGKRMTASVLDDVPGLGPGRKKRLVRELGGVNAVKGRVAGYPAGSVVAAGPGRRGRVRQIARLAGRVSGRPTSLSFHAFRRSQRDQPRVRNGGKPGPSSAVVDHGTGRPDDRLGRRVRDRSGRARALRGPL